MKTPEEIKRGLGCCLEGFCKNCSYEEILNCTESVMEDALDYIRQLEAQVPKWISVDERLPKDKQYVLIMWNGVLQFGFYKPNRREWVNLITGCDTKYKVTHWMPLPEPPEGASHGQESD